MQLQRFAWKDRDTAARDMMQLVYHGPKYVRRNALEILQGIRSASINPDLKAIAIDAEWSPAERSAALYALASRPGNISIEELTPLVKTYLDGRWNLVQEARGTSASDPNPDQLYDEYWMLMSIFRVANSHPVNRNWLLELLEHSSPALQCNVLTAAIGAVCQQELEPILMGRLTALIELYPELLTLETANDIANHGVEEPPKFLMEHIDTLISLFLATDEMAVSSVLNFSPALTSKVAETHPELAKFSLHYPYLDLLGENAAPPEPDLLSEPPPPKLWQQMERLYQKAVAGDEKAFKQLYELPDDFHTDILIQAAATHFLGKLWSHEDVLYRLCELAITEDRTWDVKHEPYPVTYAPVRFEAAYALRETATPQAWETLIDLALHGPNYSIPFDVLDWIAELTDKLSSDEASESSEGKRPVHYLRPWVDALAELPDDLDEILQRL